MGVDQECCRVYVDAHFVHIFCYQHTLSGMHCVTDPYSRVDFGALPERIGLALQDVLRQSVQQVVAPILDTKAVNQYFRARTGYRRSGLLERDSIVVSVRRENDHVAMVVCQTKYFTPSHTIEERCAYNPSEMGGSLKRLCERYEAEA